jgi:hypothetical protein
MSKHIFRFLLFLSILVAGKVSIWSHGDNQIATGELSASPVSVFHCVPTDNIGSKTGYLVQASSHSGKSHHHYDAEKRVEDESHSRGNSSDTAAQLLAETLHLFDGLLAKSSLNTSWLNSSLFFQVLTASRHLVICVIQV